MNYQVHPTAIIDSGARIGQDSRIWHWVHICSGARIGRNCSFGQNVFVGNKVIVGNNVKIQNNVSVYDNVTLEDDVFCGPSMVFTNVYNPRSAVSRKDEYRNTLVRRGATLGANSTIVCGVTIGEYAFIGAGAVINRDVPDFALMAGVPARQVGWMSKFGEQLDLPIEGQGVAVCPHTGDRYRLENGICKPDLSRNDIVIPFIDLAAQQRTIRPQLEKNINKVLAHGRYIMGPEVAQLEERLAAYAGVKHCIGVASGSDALQVALMALDIGYGDEVITTPFSFIATAEIIALLGAVPVFVDVDSRTYNINPDLIEAAITKKTKAIMPVSLYGQCADFDRINAIAGNHNLPVIEDGAQSFGAVYKGRRSCALSTIGCTSFFPSKPLGGYGDSGACFTDDDNLAKVMREIRVHGQDRRYHHPRIGFNGRLDTLQAAILLAKFDIFPQEVEKRADIGNRYSAMVQEQCLDIVTPFIEERNSCVYAQYTIQVKNRTRVQERLKEKGIPTAVHYPIPLHKQPVFMDQNVSLPVSEGLSERVLSLPMHSLLDIETQQIIVNALKGDM